MSGENMSVVGVDKRSIAALAAVAISSPPPLVEKKAGETLLVLCYLIETQKLTLTLSL